MKKLYLAVTADEYELPLCVAETPEELGKAFNITKSSVLSRISRHKNPEIAETASILFLKIDMMPCSD